MIWFNRSCRVEKILISIPVDDNGESNSSFDYFISRDIHYKQVLILYYKSHLCKWFVFPKLSTNEAAFIHTCYLSMKWYISVRPFIVECISCIKMKMQSIQIEYKWWLSLCLNRECV